MDGGNKTLTFVVSFISWQNQSLSIKHYISKMISDDISEQGYDFRFQMMNYLHLYVIPIHWVCSTFQLYKKHLKTVKVKL